MSKCGLGSFQPGWIQRLATIGWFTFFASTVTFLQGVYVGYLLGVLTTIEKRFEIRSQYSGALLSCWDAGYCVTVLIIGHFANHINKPRWIAMGVTLIGISNFGLALPNVVFGPVSPHSFSDTTAPNSELCGVNRTNLSGNVELLQGNTNSMAYWLIAVVQMICGIASAPAVTLVFVYVDDNCTKSRSPFLISFILSMMGFGPAAGFAFSSVCTNIYVTLEAPLGMTPKDPNWIGAWWLGLVINGCLLLLFGAPLYLFPAHLQRTSDMEMTTVHRPTVASEDVVKPPPTDQHCWITDTFLKLYKIVVNCCILMKNPIMFTLTLSSILEATLWSGFTAFSPKYLETQFHQSAHSANLISALGQALSNGISVIVGGKLLSHFSPSPKNMCLLMIVSNCIALVTYIVGGFLGCENIPIEGWLHSSSQTAYGCASNCFCSGKLSPVCSGNLTFFTACDAGCAEFNTTSIQYQQCSCTAAAVAVDGSCLQDCPALLPYLIVIYTGSAFGALFSVASTNIRMWSVPKSMKSQAIALSSLLQSLLGFMPSQIIFGRIVDTTCAYWSGGNGLGADGYCQLYRSEDLRHKLHFSTATILTASILAICATYWVSRRFSFPQGGRDRLDSIISGREVHLRLNAHQDQMEIDDVEKSKSEGD